MLQVFLNVAVFGMAPQAAIEAPRFATYSYPGSFEPHEYHADKLRIERGLAAEVGDAMAGKGHKVVTWPDWTWKAGGVCTITIDHASGVLRREQPRHGLRDRLVSAAKRDGADAVLSAWHRGQHMPGASKWKPDGSRRRGKARPSWSLS